MQTDLALLQSGKSVKRLRRLERRLARTRTALAAAGSVAVLATVAVLLFAEQAKVERESRKRIQEALNRAEAAEQTARQESYARAMLLAHESVKASNFGLVRKLLEQTRSFAMGDGTADASPSALAWEWRHLNYECRDEAAAVLARCARSVDAVAVSPDAKWLAAGTGDGRVLLWGLPERQLRQEWQMLRVNVECLSFSPDNRQLALGYIDGSVRVLAIPSGELITELRERSRIVDLRFSLDGTSLDYCGEFRHSRYNFTTQSHWHGGTTIGMWRAAIAPDLSCLAVGLQPQGLVLYSPITNAVFQDVTGNRFHDHGFAISPDGRWLAAALADHSIQLWSLAEKRPMGRLSGHTAAIRAVAWSADSRLLASGGYDQTVAVWDPGRGTLLRRLRGHRDHVSSLAFSPDGRSLYSGSYDRTVRIWTDLETDPAPSAIALPVGVVNKLLAPRAGFAAGVAADNIVWTLKTQPAPMTHSRQTESGDRVGISADGRWLVAGHVLNDVCEVWRYETNRFLIHSTHNAMGTADAPPVFSHDGDRIALLATNGVLAVWQLDPWRELARWEGVEAGGKAIVFDPPGKRVFVRCQNFGVIAADMETGRLSRMPKEGKSAISGMDISPDNRLVAMSSFDGTIVLWACAPGEEPRSLGPVVTEDTDTWSVAFSPDGQRLAVGLSDGNIHIWDFKRRIPVGVLKGHRQGVWELGFSPDDDTLVSLSPDELRVWRVADGR